MNTMSLDVRGMEAPEPAKRIVEELKYLMKSEVLEVRGDKPFRNMLPMLEEKGYRCEMEESGGEYILRIRNDGSAEPIDESELDCGGDINENTNVGKLLKEHPEAMQILIDSGFTPLNNPAMRHLASTVSLKTASKMIGMDEKGLSELIERLKEL